jgi:hypothetical protein
MANTVSLSQGNSFACTFAWTPGAAGPANLLATTITSDIRDHCGTLYALDVTIADDGLSFTVVYPDSTSDWSIGQSSWDIKFVFPGPPTAISRTEVFRVNVVSVVTA